MDSMVKDRKPSSYTSSEGEIDRRSERLLGRIVAGSASPKDMASYHELSVQRSYLMKKRPSGSVLVQAAAKSRKK